MHVMNVRSHAIPEAIVLRHFAGVPEELLTAIRLVCYLIVSRMIHALTILGQSGLQDQNSEVICQASAEFHRVQVHIV
jgi:hypothetical protein